MRLDLKTNTFTFYYDSHKSNIEKIFAKSHGHLNKTQRYSIIERVCLHFEDAFELYKGNLPFLHAMFKKIKVNGKCNPYRYEEGKDINVNLAKLGGILRDIIDFQIMSEISVFELGLNKLGTITSGAQVYDMTEEIIAITKHHINTVLKKMPEEKLFQEQCRQSGIKIQYKKSTDSYNLIGKLCPDAKIKKIVKNQDTTDKEFRKPIIGIPLVSFSSIGQDKRSKSCSTPPSFKVEKRRMTTKIGKKPLTPSPVSEKLAFRDRILRLNKNKTIPTNSIKLK